MTRAFLIISIICSLNVLGQNPEIENLINQIADYEVSENFEFYYLVPQSLGQPKIYDSLQNFEIRELKRMDKDFPMDLIYQKSDDGLNWTNYKLKNVKYFSEERGRMTSPPTNKRVLFVNYNIGQKEYDSLIKHKEPYTLIVKKKWWWNKNNIWENKKFHAELKNAWGVDEGKNIEEKVIFHFSSPLFSKDGNYARVSIFKNWRCSGMGFTALYKKDNGIWRKLVQYNGEASQIVMTHSKCGDISIRY